MLTDKRIAFIGGGNMSEALIAGLLHSRVARPLQLSASDILASRREYLKSRFGITTMPHNRDATKNSDFIVLAVEPQVLDEVLKEIHSVITAQQLILSVAAGYPIARIKQFLTHTDRIVRSMPNTASTVREGMTALAYSDGLPEQDRSIAETIFASVGRVVEVEERLMDAVTALSGSGPAYIFLAIEALADGGVKMGLPRAAAELLAAQTMLGAARMLIESGEHPGRLKDRVASPAGTTIAGLHALEEGKARATLISAVESATRRSRELGQQQTKQ